MTTETCAEERSRTDAQMQELGRGLAKLSTEKTTARRFLSILGVLCLAFSSWALNETAELKAKEQANAKEHEHFHVQWSDVKDNLTYIRTRLDELTRQQKP